MFISQLSIRKPVLTWVMNLLLILFGLVGLSRLPVREVPSVDPPIVNVMTVYPGASAEVVETEVTLRLEDEISGVEGIKTLTSQSSEGVSSITVLFNLDRPIEVAAQDVRDRVARVRGQLPADAEEPVISKQDSDAQAGLWIALSSDRLSAVELTALAENELKDALQTVPGVSSVTIGGAKRYAVRIWLDPAKMAARGITVGDVNRALNEQNVELPSGNIQNLDREMAIETRGSMASANEFNRLVIKQSGDTLVRLQDIGQAADGVEDEEGRFRSNGRPTLGLGIVKQAQANTVEVSKGIEAELERLRPTLSADIEMVVAYNEATYVEHAIREVWITLAIAFALVVLVIFIFLRNLRSTIIPSLAIPVSIVATFAVLYFFGFSINIVTMLGLVLAIGIVVDDAIVVLENIHRHIEEGLSPMEAARKGMDEIAFAVIVTTIALVAIFIPLVFQTSTAGRMFVELAVAVSGAVLISSFVALTLAPMVAARLLRDHEPAHGRIYEGIERAFTRLGDRYDRGLAWALRHRFRIMLTGLLSLAASAVLFIALPSEFLPDDDKGLFFSFLMSPQGSTAEYTDRMVAKAEGILAEVPEVEYYLSFVGMIGGDPSQGGMFVTLKEDRERSVQDVIGGPAGIGARFFGEVEGAIAVPIVMKAIATSFGQSFQLVLQNQDMPALATYAQKLVGQLQQAGYLNNVRSSFEISKLQVSVDIDRDRAAVLGVSIQEISSTLQMLYGGMDLSRFKREGREYDVIVQLAREDRLTPQSLESVYVRGSGGKLIPLSNVVRMREAVAPSAIAHHNRLRSATIEGTPVGIPIGEAVKRVETLLRDELPDGFRYEWEGESRELKETGGQMAFVMLLAALIVYLVLAAQFESWVSPMIVMLALPLAAVGGLGALWLLGYVNVLGSILFAMSHYMPDPSAVVQTLSAVVPRIPAMNINLYSQIGLLLLFGLATKNSILLVEFANQRREDGDSPLDAMRSAGRTRFRPILMTAFSTIAGMLPIAIGFGSGAASRRPMGVVVVGGMLTSTLLVLFVVPVVYVVVGEWSERRRRALAAAPVSQSASPLRQAPAWLLAAGLAGSALFQPLRAEAEEPAAPELPAMAYSIDAAVNLALEQNPDVLAARQELDAAAGSAMQSRSAVRPTVRAQSSYGIQDRDLIETFSETVKDQNWGANLRVVQSVYEGGRLRSSLATARLVETQAFQEYQRVAAGVVRDVRSAYYDALLAREEIAVQEASVKQLEEELAYSRRRFEAGSVPEFNVLRAEVELAGARPKWIRARNQYATRKSELLTRLGVDLLEEERADIPVELTDTLQTDYEPSPLPEALLQARENRPELAAQRSVIALQEQGVVQARAGRKPRLEIYGGYEARNSMLTDSLSDEVHGWVAGAQMSWDIFDGALVRGQVKEAQARLAQARTALDKQARQIDLEVRTAFSDWGEAQEVLASQNKVLEQAEEALRQAASRNKSGASTQLDVLAAQTSLTDARTTQALALHGVAVAAVRLEYAMGLTVVGDQ